MPIIDFSKRYTHSDGGFTKDGARCPGSYAAFNDATGSWTAYYADGTLFFPAYATMPVENEDWHGAGPQPFLDDGTWVELPDSPVITTQEEQEMNPIFGYQASQELNSDSWKQLVLASKDFPNVDVLKDTFKKWETEFKEETGQEIPGAWRSAKSVIKNALANGVKLLDEEDKPLGKTAVETAVKSSKALSTAASYAITLPLPVHEKVGDLLLTLAAHGFDANLIITDGRGGKVIYK